MRAKNVEHAQFEIFKCILDTIDLTEVKAKLCPSDDTPERKKVAEKRFNDAYVSVAGMIDGYCERRRHKLPKNHVDYKEKEE